MSDKPNPNVGKVPGVRIQGTGHVTNPKKHAPAVEEILRFFEYRHLPDYLQSVSKPMFELAHEYAKNLEGRELTVGLRKLLEAKDAFVRAALP